MPHPIQRGDPVRFIGTRTRAGVVDMVSRNADGEPTYRVSARYLGVIGTYTAAQIERDTDIPAPSESGVIGGQLLLAQAQRAKGVS